MKTEEKAHTPGPWIANRHTSVPHDVTAVNSPADGGDIICEAPAEFKDSMRRWAANSQLIAAAPDLLEALKRCENFIANTEGELGLTLNSGELARAAIAKAEGR